MNRLTSLLTLTLLLTALGCAGLSAERRALNTIGTIGTTANAAIGAYHVYLQSNAVPPAQFDAAAKAIRAYSQANQTARTAITSYKSGTTDRAALDRAIDALAAASTDLVTLISTITSTR